MWGLSSTELSAHEGANVAVAAHWKPVIALAIRFATLAVDEVLDNTTDQDAFLMSQDFF